MADDERGLHGDASASLRDDDDDLGLACRGLAVTAAFARKTGDSMPNVYAVVVRFPADDVPVFSSNSEKDCVSFLLKHSHRDRVEELRELAERCAQRSIPADPIGFDVYQIAPEVKLVSADDLPGSPATDLPAYEDDYDDDDDDDYDENDDWEDDDDDDYDDDDDDWDDGTPNDLD